MVQVLLFYHTGEDYASMQSVWETIKANNNHIELKPICCTNYRFMEDPLLEKYSVYDFPTVVCLHSDGTYTKSNRWLKKEILFNIDHIQNQIDQAVNYENAQLGFK